MKLPLRIDKTPEGKLVPPAEIGTEGYAENIEYTLTTETVDEKVKIAYYGEDDTWLSGAEVKQIIYQCTKST